MENLSLAEAPPAAAPRPGSSLRGCWFWAGWEPDRYYRRIGARKTPYFGNGDWVAGWRENLESETNLDALVQAGATVLVTRFYKGFGPEIEREDWPSLREFVRRAHERNLAVWGYVQGQSLFGEFLFNERPEAADWIARTDRGEPQHWAGAYNRYAPCLTSPAYREMIEDVVEEGLCGVELDGIHMDNNYYRHCYCPRCKELFRQWLTARGDLELRTGIRNADFVEPPPLSGESVLVPDPLAILWMEFGVQKRLEFMQAIRRKIRTVKPDADFAGNPAFLRTYASRLTHALDPALEGTACDSLCIENGNQPRMDGEKLFTQADKHLFAEAAGLRTWVTSWRPGDFGSSPPSTAAEIWAGLAEEFSFAHGYLGNNWALRPAANGNRLLREHLDKNWRTFCEASRFFLDLETLLSRTPRRQWGEIGLYVDPRALSICPQPDAMLLQVFLLGLLRANVPLKILLRGQSFPAEMHTILLFQQRALEGAELDRLTEFAATEGRELWNIGANGVYDEWCVPRSQNHQAVWMARPHVRSFPLSAGQWLRQEGSSAQYFKGQCPQLQETGRRELHAIVDTLKPRQRIGVEAPDGVLSNVETLETGGWLVHLRNLRDEPICRPVHIFLQHDVPGHPVVTEYSVRAAAGRPLSCVKENGKLVITVPPFAQYGAVGILP